MCMAKNSTFTEFVNKMNKYYDSNPDYKNTDSLDTHLENAYLIYSKNK